MTYIYFSYQGQNFRADLSKPIDISMTLQPNGENVNCYWAAPVQATIIRAGEFVGSVAQGGTVNYQELRITPHGNGTHTECYGHISADEGATIDQCLQQFFFTARLISLEPELQASGDYICSYAQFSEKCGADLPEAIIIRTLPNTATKLRKQYSGTNPPYLEAAIASHLASKGVKHLLIDLPSIDREEDGGRLAAHRAFWQYPQQTRKDCTITELIYVEDSIEDGDYLLNLQVLNLAMDASPSRPVIYAIKPASS